MQKHNKIYIAGHRGMVGSAIHRCLIDKGYDNFVFTPSNACDLRNQHEVSRFFEKEKPDYVILAAAKVGGIMANNTYRAEFLYDNLQIQNHVIHQSYLQGVKKLLFLGSSCIYPKNAPQPLKEEYLLTGPLEYTNEPYAIAKIAGMKMCEAYNMQYHTNFISVMPTNLYGPNDNYNLETSHVFPALIRKIHLAKAFDCSDFTTLKKDLGENMGEKEITNYLESIGIHKNKGETILKLWGSGNPYREFLHVDDLAQACIFLMENKDFEDIVPKETDQIINTHINIGTGKDLQIHELAKLMARIIGFTGSFLWDSSKPDGTPKKQLDVSKILKLGWNPGISLEDGIKSVYSYYLSNQ